MSKRPIPNNIKPKMGVCVLYLKTFYALCKVAKVIACHNIFICSNGENKKYEQCKLNHLIPGNAKFRRMPHQQNYLRDDYEKLYYLLCLTDALEPSKRSISLNDINLNITSN